MLDEAGKKMLGEAEWKVVVYFFLGREEDFW